MLILLPAVALTLTRQLTAPTPLNQRVHEYSLAAAQAHSYALKLARGEAAIVLCEQRGIDVVIRVLGPDGKEMRRVDTTGTTGPERVVVVAQREGEYRLVVTPFEEKAPVGKYTLVLDRRLKAGRTRAERLKQLIGLHTIKDGPGAAVVVEQGGKLLYKVGFGRANLEYAIPNTSQTVFHTASVSKQFTAFAIALLAQQGKLSYDDDIHKYLPELHDFGQPITIRNLLTHTSGLRDQWEMLAIAGWRLDDVITQDHIRRMAFRATELNFSPGTQFLYSNMGYSLLAEIVERVSKEPFPTFMKTKVFQPLGMSHTRIHDDHRELVPNRAYSYGMGPQGWEARPLNYANQGATSLFSTAEDLALWLDNLDTRKLGGGALVDVLQTPGQLKGGKALDYGFGLSVGTYRGLKTIGHDGADAGFRSSTLRFPEQHLGIVVLSNQADFDPNGLAHQLADLFLEGKFPPEKPAPSPESAPAITVPLETLQRYVGIYKLRDDWYLDIGLQNGELTVQASRESRFPMRAESETRFFVPAYNAPIAFQADSLLYKGITAPRVAPFHPSPAELAAFAGEYYSPEAATTYTLRVREGKLVAEHPRNEPITLTPALPNTFRGNAWFFGEVHFEKNSAGAVTGLTVSGSRVRHLRFEKK